MKKKLLVKRLQDLAGGNTAKAAAMRNGQTVNRKQLFPVMPKLTNIPQRLL